MQIKVTLGSNVIKMRKILLLFVAIIVLGSCQKDDENIKNQEPPYLTDAGGDILNVEEFEVDLNADALTSTQYGFWTIHSGLVDEKVFFKDSKNPKTTFHGLPDEEYELIWTLGDDGKIARDTITVTFSPLRVEIQNLSPKFYRTRIHLRANKYERGKWSIEGDYHHIWNQYPPHQTHIANLISCL